MTDEHVMSIKPYRIDPDDPRAPPQEVWERLSPKDRARIVKALPSEFPVSEEAPPEGDAHFMAKVGARRVLEGFFTQMGRKVCLGSELPVYYPGERMFAPDLIAVMGVEPHERMSWVVSAEGKGLDFALEIHVAEERHEELERNVERFARLGIREYFIFDRGRLRLTGWRLEAGGLGYRDILPQRGFFTSEVLGLDLRVEGERLRFHQGRAPLLDADEMIATLERRIRESEVQCAEEARLLAEETRRREASERQLAEALAELARLRGGLG